MSKANAFWNWVQVCGVQWDSLSPIGRDGLICLLGVGLAGIISALAGAEEARIFIHQIVFGYILISTSRSQ